MQDTNMNFQKYFLLENTSPIIAYHGTRSKFAKFDIGKIGTGHRRFANGIGMYFNSNRDSVKPYLINPYTYEPDGRIIKAVLDIKNPLKLSTHALDQSVSREEAQKFTDKIRAEGYDGVMVDHISNIEYVVFDPSQIKIIR